MKNITWINEKIGYFDAPTTPAVIRVNENEVAVVDPGINFEAGRKLSAALKREGLVVKSIINTHSHADHYGANTYFLKNQDVSVYFPSGEAGIARFPIWEPFYLYGGVPPSEMKVPFLMPDPTTVTYEIEPGELFIDEIKLTITDLSGHSYFQVGVEVEGILYAADSLFSPELWEKHTFVYFADYDKAIETIKFIKTTGYKGLILSHRGFYDDISALADFNLLKLENLFQAVLNALIIPSTTDEILMRVAEEFGTSFDSLPSYYLARQTTHSVLTSAKEKGLVEFDFSEKGLIWIKKP